MIDFYLFQLPIHYIWIAAGILIAGTEFLLPTQTSMWPGLGAVVVGILIWTGILGEYSWAWQFFWFSALTGIFLLLWFFVLKKYTRYGLETVDQHRDVTLYDIKGIVTERIERGEPGSVELYSPYHGIKKWKALSDSPIEAGEKVHVIDADGIKLIVQKTEE